MSACSALLTGNLSVVPARAYGELFICMSGVALHYRPDIDGLRAVAVISVLLFHAFPDRLPGGFVGVDIFFVISGYLISGIILKDLQRGNFSFADFYARRVGRIFPALVLVLTVCLAFGWFVLLPDEYVQVGKHTVAGAAFMSNLLLWHQSGYFDASAQSKPLLHLWSLGIEEQFYILWPLLLVLFWKRTKRILVVICLLALTSFFLNVILVGRVPSLIFYLPITRVWELLIGGALAQSTLQRGAVRSPMVNNLFAAIGSLLIAVSLALISESRAFPGWWALLPTLGTALVIGAGSQAWVNRKLLSAPACVFIGLISYPLYLWHWPILVYLKLIVDSDFALSPTRLKLLKVGALAISGVLAWATWRFWESPIRHPNHMPRRIRVQGLASGMCAVTAFGALSVTNVITARLDNPSVMRIVQAFGDWDYPSSDNFMKSAFVSHEVRSNSDRVTLFVGDSHMEQYWPRVKTAIQNNPDLATAVFATSSGCLPFPTLNRAKPGFACPKFYNYWTREASGKNVSTVVIGAAWEYYFLGQYPGGPVPPAALSVAGRPANSTDVAGAWTDFESKIDSLVRSGKRVVILSSSPASAAFNPRGMFSRFSGFIRPRPVNKTAFNRFIAPVEDRLIQIADRTGATVIRPADYFCESEVCPATDADGDPLYRDDQHLRPGSTIRKATFIDDTLQLSPSASIGRLDSELNASR
jgi:peptidoglycan/LPS O-acetylase OafA/YrhL